MNKPDSYSSCEEPAPRKDNDKPDKVDPEAAKKAAHELEDEILGVWF